MKDNLNTILEHLPEMGITLPDTRSDTTIGVILENAVGAGESVSVPGSGKGRCWAITCTVIV